MGWLQSRHAICGVLLICVLLVSSTRVSQGYSVLSHEAVIDAAWDTTIRPLLLQRFPGSTPDQLKKARAYAYGGSVIQDLGYYPFGSLFFSDLVHYVRTGDFIKALLRDSKNLNDYAFALGVLAHYASDSDGHRIGINRAEPILYPKLKRKFGDVVVYDEDPAKHLKTDFAFDVLQVARGNYATDAYHSYIGFEVSPDLLAQAFQETYALDLKSIFENYDLAIGSYRRGVSEVIPEMTKVAWQIKKDEIQKEAPGLKRDRFVYRVSGAEYNRQWGKMYNKPGLGARILALLIHLIPKVGPFSALSFHAPTPDTEKMFVASFDASVRDYDRFVRQEHEDGRIELPNNNFDTGAETGPGEYPLADRTYANLLSRLAKQQFAGVSPELREDILAYYRDLNEPFFTKRKKKDWARLLQQLDDLKAFSPTKQEGKNALELPAADAARN